MGRVYHVKVVLQPSETVVEMKSITSSRFGDINYQPARTDDLRGWEEHTGDVRDWHVEWQSHGTLVT